MPATDPRDAVLACAAAADGDVAEGALWLAAEDCDGVGVEVGARLAELELIAAEVRTRLGGSRPAVAAVAVLAATLRDRLDLRGGAGDDPRCHYLHTVMARGTGIPIACSALWIAVGRRAGIAVEGVGFPGHFVVRVGQVLVDAHGGGEILDDAAAVRLIAAATGSAPSGLAQPWPAAASTREMLARMSRNLRACHAGGRRWTLALRSADRCVDLLPEEPVERRERGLLRFRMGLAWPALRDLRAYLDACPGARDRRHVERIAAAARAMLN